jgi:hypothetical protein
MVGMFIQRTIETSIIERLTRSDKIIILFGARQVGKTTLAKRVIEQTGYRTLSVNGDELRYADVLSSRDLRKLQGLVGGYEMLFIDEAQRIPEIGINLKILHDALPQLKILVTGSSSLDLASQVSEPLTGRKWTYWLYPISFLELQASYNTFELDQQIEERLVYGMYPEIFAFDSDRMRQQYLEELMNAYLYKDVLQLAGIKHAAKLHDMVKLLAFQIGSEVSLSELGSNLGMSKDTVSHYIDLLEQSFVIFRLRGLNRNLRKEVSKMSKIYFYDLGVRNVVIDFLKPLGNRNDQGQLWENFLILERLKSLAYLQTSAARYFWRVHTGAEIDYVEERQGRFFGYEMKWGNRLASPPASWLTAYPQASFQTINRQNYLEFLTRQPA